MLDKSLFSKALLEGKVFFAILDIDCYYDWLANHFQELEAAFSRLVD